MTTRPRGRCSALERRDAIPASVSVATTFGERMGDHDSEYVSRTLARRRRDARVRSGNKDVEKRTTRPRRLGRLRQN